MNCDCIEKRALRIKEIGGYKTPITEVSTKEDTFRFDGIVRTVTYFIITLEGEARKKEVYLLHNFCPFCGKNQRPKEEQRKGEGGKDEE